MERRRYLGSLGAVLGGASLTGCAGLVPLGARSDDSDYPGGTLILENTGGQSVSVSVTVSSDEYDAALETPVAGGETVVRREFVTAKRGDVVTLVARLGVEGEPIEFQNLPAGGSDDAPPEVARLTFENAVGASATWSASRGN